MLLRRLIVLLLVLISCNMTLGQRAGILRGIVTDATNGEVLPYCNVIIEGTNKGASTNRDGIFVIPAIQSNKTYSLKISYVGYLSKTMSVRIYPRKVTHVDIELEPNSFELQTVEKIGNKVVESNATDVGLTRIAIKDLEGLPKGVETDIFRSLQYLPGVKSTGDVSAKYFVRGGTNNQNLILLDGVTLYNPFHAMGLFSAIDPEIINNVEFYKGGFTSEYGGRLSSVLRVETKDGNKNNFSSRGSLSYLAGKLMVEGPFPFGSFFISGRKSYSSAILKKFLNDKNVPSDFYDLNFKLKMKYDEFLENATFTIHGFFSEDHITQSDPTMENYNWGTKFISAKWQQIGTDVPLFYEVGFSASSFNGVQDPKQSTLREKKNELTDFSFNADFTYVYGNKNELGIGLHIKEVHTSLKLQTFDQGTAEINEKGTNFTAYAKYKVLSHENFGADIGLRANLTRLAKGTAGNYILEPRLSVTGRLSPFFAIKAALGIYNQELTTISDENELVGIFEPWVITPEYLEPAQSVHYILGFDFDLTDNFSFELEPYYKDINNIAIVNNRKVFMADKDLIPANGYAYGVDFSARLKAGDMNLMTSYSYGYVRQKIERDFEKEYFPAYDARHSFNCSVEYNLGKGWKSSVIWVYHSGHPYTKIYGFYDKFYPNKELISKIYEGYLPYSILGEKNTHRLPHYHRLDITLSKKFIIGPLQCTFDASIINAYDRENIFYYRRDTAERVNMLPILPTMSLKVAI